MDSRTYIPYVLCVCVFLSLTLALKFSLFVSFSSVLCDNAQCGTHMVLITTLSDRTVLGRALPARLTGYYSRPIAAHWFTINRNCGKSNGEDYEFHKRNSFSSFFFCFFFFSLLFFAPTEFPYYYIYSKIALRKFQTLIVSVRRNSL